MSRLSETARYIKEGMNNLATGPLEVAAKVVELAEHWNDYREEAGKLSFTQWMTKELGNKKTNLAYFRHRHRAVQELGEHIRRTMDHRVAGYVLNQVPEFQWKTVTEVLVQQCIKNNHCPLSPGQAIPLIKKIVGWRSTKKVCARCVELEEEIRRLRTIDSERIDTVGSERKGTNKNDSRGVHVEG